MSDTPGIGCGIWPVILRDTRYYLACAFHDSAYKKNSWYQERFARLEMDRLFLLQMLEINKDYPYQWFHDLRARLFYGLARLFGGFFWEGER